MTTPLASVSALEARLGQSLTAIETVRALAILEDASALVRAEVNETWLDDDGVTLSADLPDLAVAVTLAVALSAWHNPMGATAERVGEYAVNYGGSPSTGAVLTSAQSRALRRLRSGGSLSTIRMYREPSCQYVEIAND